MGKPLDGVRVVDLSQLTSGPLATMVLAEQGRRRREGRAARPGGPLPPERVLPRRVQRLVAEPQPREAWDLRQHGHGRGSRAGRRAHGRRRRGRAELPAWRRRPAGLRLRRHQGAQPPRDLRVDQRVRPHRSLRQPAGRRPDHPGAHRRSSPASRARPSRCPTSCATSSSTRPPRSPWRRPSARRCSTASAPARGTTSSSRCSTWARTSSGPTG